MLCDTKSRRLSNGRVQRPNLDRLLGRRRVGVTYIVRDDEAKIVEDAVD
jgi:hypothetical protein